MERADLGRTPGFAEVEVAASTRRRASLVNVRVTGSDGSRLHGRTP